MSREIRSVIRRVGILLLLVLFSESGIAQDKRHSNRKSVCTVPHPESICNDNNICGSNGECTIDVKRTADSAASIASIADAKANAPFCVKTGTKITWHSLSKNTGFVIDPGPASPFDPPGAIIGGSDRSVTVVAKNPGCFKYSTGACVSGATYGMCDSADADVVVVGSQ